MLLHRIVWLAVIVVLAGPRVFGDESDIKALLADGNAAAAEVAARRAVDLLDARNPEGTLETAAVLDLLAAALDAEAAGVARVREAADRAIAIKSRILGPKHFS